MRPRPLSLKSAARTLVCLTLLLGLHAVARDDLGERAEDGATIAWETDFFDDFLEFDFTAWEDHTPWVNNEDHCYVRDGQFGTREVSEGTLKLRVIDLGQPRPCTNRSKDGRVHPATPFVGARIATKNKREFSGGRWSARLRVPQSGQPGMFPAWWLLGARNNEDPRRDPDETVCWPMVGSGEVDIFEHHGEGGADRYAARIIESDGTCGGGDWQASMLLQETDLDQFHEFAVAWIGADLVFTLDGKEVYRLKDKASLLPEPMFAILNFAKIDPGPIGAPWVMEVDWVRHERAVLSHE